MNSITLGDFTFSDSLSTIVSNLPHLNSINLGKYALYGRDDLYCSLVMGDLPDLESITSNGNSFYQAHSVTLSNIPNLKTVKLSDSFSQSSFCKVQTKSINNVSSLLASLVRVSN